MLRAKTGIQESRLAELLHRYGWVLLFWVVCFTLYSQAMHKKSVVYSELKENIRDLESLKALTELEREDLALQIYSQNDADWIEMVLKKNLGVVPEGQTKVYFKKDE